MQEESNMSKYDEQIKKFDAEIASCASDATKLNQLNQGKAQFIANYEKSLAGICKCFDEAALEQWLSDNPNKEDALNQPLIDEDGELPLTFSCRQQSSRKQIPFIRKLLGRGAKINAPNHLPQKSTALHIATQRGDKKLVTTLLDYDADPNIREQTAGYTSFHLAILQNDIGIVEQYLFKNSTDVYCLDKMGNAPYPIII